ncbi:MupA/Atu3671 family FMN-dependent luciferase-like monooxygenase [Sphingomonas sp. IW22]|uniref:MupA/Atu3671 family FMN-dependent luciferase-like monooxygenase n=1 Tax=Sphingomonas sp. IW22 TaxID=3242489 RepID=UPI0035212E18
MHDFTAPPEQSQPASTQPLDAPSPSRLRAVFIGDESLLCECADIWVGHGNEIAAIVTASGPAARYCDRRGTPRIARIADLSPDTLGPIDYLFSITNLRILPGALLAWPKSAAINFHDGPLPRYAGINTPSWALLAGERTHGVSWHQMTDAVDGGALFEVEPVAIDPGETALSLNTKCMVAGRLSFARLAARIAAGSVEAVPQTGPLERWYGREHRPAMAATIDWSQSAEAIALMVSALDFGSYRNPLGCPKALVGGRLLLVHQLEILDQCSGERPGTVVAGGSAPVVATGGRDVRLTRLTDADGRPLQADAILVPSMHFEALGPEQADALSALDAAAATHEGGWRKRLLARDPLLLPAFQPVDPGPDRQTMDQPPLPPAPVSSIVVAVITLFGRTADRDTLDIGYSDPVHALRIGDCGAWFAEELPLRAQLDWQATLQATERRLAAAIADLHRRVGIARDLIARSPELKGQHFAHPVSIRVVDNLDHARFDQTTIVGVAVEAATGRVRWQFDPARIHPSAVHDLSLGLAALMDDASVAPDRMIGELALMSPEEMEALRRISAGDGVTFDANTPIHRLFVKQAASTPDRIAVTSRGVSLSYAELDRRSNRLARYLSRLDVGPGVLVGLNLERSVDLIVAMLAIHKAGGAYVPLDPAYPDARLAHMIDDSGLSTIVTQHSLSSKLQAANVQLVEIDFDATAIDAMSDTPFDGGASGDSLAYVIYTSGSTGKPKGVMVEHRNVANFFTGMNAHLEDTGVWLAVTSPSFDISVLELCWPLTRGYHVVIATEREVRGDVPLRPTAATAARPLGFSLFYFASAPEDGVGNTDQYRLLIEGARFADDHGFEAIWTPERHFHAFGGLYPNPSVISAAIAVSTTRVQIRAGSCVATLHHPARIAEEWALVDNLSHGRVGIAFAAGWQPNDFALRPENFADKNAALMRAIADVRALWRGEKRRFPGPTGTPVEIGVFPRPVQPELPFWITSAGNPETFAAAGRAGANLLTHLLGQSVEEVAVKLTAYREAWRAAGHPGEGKVTMMLHSFVSDDEDAVRRIVRGPLIEYLRTSTSLLKEYAWSFPAFRRPAGTDATEQPDLGSLTPEETDALLDHAFDRYFESSGLFGTPAHCIRLIERLRDAGVDEIGCLIDFGVAAQTVLDHLPHLDALRRLATEPARESVERTLPELIARHGVTHLQCTPSLVQMLASDAQSRAALAGLTRLMVGGEAFPASLAHDMTALVRGAVMNMYGPTETTIWSAVHTLAKSANGPPPLGTPLANQQLHVVDTRGQPVRPGTPGELLIGGAGVVRGYLKRDELTAERFVNDRFAGGGARAYRTGDVVRRAADGRIEFLGRVDHQIKIRGYRVELGEIEALLLDQPAIAEAVVIARGNEGVMRLIAYIVPALGAKLDEAAMRALLARGLPDFMVPATFVSLDAMPRTPNGKIDRAALPDPVVALAAPGPTDRAIILDDPLQAQIIEIWRDVLKIPSVGLRDNFFDLGGHSLLAVQAHRRLAQIVERPISLTDMFRFPTVETLSAHLSGGAQIRVDTGGRDRARNRQRAMQRRAMGAAGAIVGG